MSSELDKYLDDLEAYWADRPQERTKHATDVCLTLLRQYTCILYEHKYTTVKDLMPIIRELIIAERAKVTKRDDNWLQSALELVSAQEKRIKALEIKCGLRKR